LPDVFTRLLEKWAKFYFLKISHKRKAGAMDNMKV
jgi:hypothetical protein